MLKNIFVCFLFSVSSFTIAAQSYSLIREIPVQAKAITTDVLDNLYITTEQNQVIKYNAQGQQMAIYNISAFGNISSLDASDPLKIIVQYAPFQKVVILDNTLSEIGRYSFTAFQPARIRLAVTARSGGFWCYDETQTRVLKISNSFDNILTTGTNLVIDLNYVPKPVSLVEFRNELYLNDTSQGIIVTDIYGTYYKTLPFKQVKSFGFANNQLWYYQNEKLHLYDTQKLEDSLQSLPTGPSPRDLKLSNNHLYIISEKAVSLWAF